MDQELANKAIVFLFFSLPDSASWDITVELRDRQKNRWAICRSGSVFDREIRKFVYERMSSHRTEEMLKLTRFDSLEEAVAEAEKIAVLYQKSYEQWEKGETRYLEPPENI